MGSAVEGVHELLEDRRDLGSNKALAFFGAHAHQPGQGHRVGRFVDPKGEAIGDAKVEQLKLPGPAHGRLLLGGSSKAVGIAAKQRAIEKLELDLDVVIEVKGPIGGRDGRFTGPLEDLIAPEERLAQGKAGTAPGLSAQIARHARRPSSDPTPRSGFAAHSAL